MAFDDYREKELERLEEERRKLDTMVDDFDDYLRNLRRAKDQEEFDQFLKNRDNHKGTYDAETDGPAGAQPQGA